MTRIRRALMSCHDKTGLAPFSQLLREFDVEIISTAGTLEILRQAGIPAVNIADYTGVPEMLDGRVKSLHPKVHAGLLGLRDSRLHVEQMQAMEDPWIDLVVVNLNPIEELVKDPNLTPDVLIEQIDIGGSALLRSAAKNFRYVTVVVDPAHYTNIMHELRAHEGSVTYLTRNRLARDAFAHTARYDRIIAEYLESVEPPPE